MSLPPSLPPAEAMEPAQSSDTISDGMNRPVEAPSRRVPNLGHALIFVGFWGVLFVMAQLGLMVLGFSPVRQTAAGIQVQHPLMQIGMLAATYALTLGSAWLFYPMVWHESFAAGIRWRWETAAAQTSQLLGLGLLLGLLMQVVSYFIKPPKELPIDQFFMSPAMAWVLTFFGTLVAPVFEEIAFRGFLLPAFAIAYDWLRLPRTDEARDRWQHTTGLSPAALLFAALLSSTLFAAIHAQQVEHMWAVLLVLFTVSLVLTYVRVRTRSVAASAMVHAGYNGFIFLMTMIATGGYRHLDRMTH